MRWAKIFSGNYPKWKTYRLPERGADGNKSDDSSAQLSRPKMSSNLSRRTLSRKATKWLLWAVSLRASNLRREFPPRLGRMFGPSNGKVSHFREYVDTAAVSRAHTVAPSG